MFHNVVATVVFVRDLARCMAFYRDTLGLEVSESDADGATFKLENMPFLLLSTSAAAELIGAEVTTLQQADGPRWLLAVGVKDVDAVYETLTARGVTFLRQPIDQPWGLRTAHFIDPEGNVWEINQPVAGSHIQQ